MGVSSVKSFFGKFNAELKSEKAPEQSNPVKMAKRIGDGPTAHGRRNTAGAFGGTGTGRARRGMPGRKLAKKMVKAGWNAQKRVVPMTARSPK